MSVFEHFVRGLGESARHNSLAYGYSLALTGASACSPGHDAVLSVPIFLRRRRRARLHDREPAVTRGFRRRVEGEPPIVLALGTSFGFVSVAAAIGIAAFVGWLLPAWVGWVSARSPPPRVPGDHALEFVLAPRRASLTGAGTCGAVVSPRMADPWFDELAEFLRIPSVSADAAHDADVMRAGEWVCAFIREAGGECELVDWHGQPLAIGEIRASADADERADGPLLRPLRRPAARPARAVGVASRSSRRSAATTSTAAAPSTTRASSTCCSRPRASSRSAGELPVNVRFCCDGEEETGGHSIVEFLEEDERGADAAIIFDSGMIRRDVPAFNVATRGLAYFHLTLRTGERDLHSGMYGGAALNAAHALIQTLDALIAHDGRSPSRSARASRAPTDEELAGWAQLPAGADELAEQGARPKDRARGRGLLPAHVRRARARRERHRDRLAASCRRRCSRSRRSRTSRSGSRPGQKVEEIAPEVERLLREAAPDGADARDRAAGRRRRPGSSRRTRRRCSSGSTRSSGRSACGRR